MPRALTADLGEVMARTAVANIGREYPNAPGFHLRSAADLRPPREVHPAFFGSYDWHSSVHQHWLLVRLLRLGMVGAASDVARAALAGSLTVANVRVEAAYLRAEPSFERPYGWAWVLALADELAAWRDPDAAARRETMEPLVAAVRDAWRAYLPRTTYPNRAGTHGNSAFAMGFALDHARSTGDRVVAGALVERAHRWFLADRAYPAHLEPGGADFLSPTLTQAQLVTRLLDPGAFGGWFAEFLPATPSVLLEPVVVADREDPQTVHLDGLNLSRAWGWSAIAETLGEGSARGAEARAAAERHLDAALPHLSGGAYVAEHWVSTFALLALTG